MSIIDTLVTDRTGGYYNAADLNRVGAALRYVADRLAAAGVSCPVQARQDWDMYDIPRGSEIRVLLDDLSSVRSALATLSSVPPVPDGARPFTVQQANDIERILVEIDAALTMLVQSVNFGWAMAQAHVGLYIPQRPALLLTQDGLVLLTENDEHLDIALFGLPACKRIDKTAVLMLAGTNQNYKLEVTAWRQ